MDADFAELAGTLSGINTLNEHSAEMKVIDVSDIIGKTLRGQCVITIGQSLKENIAGVQQKRSCMFFHFYERISIITLYFLRCPW